MKQPKIDKTYNHLKRLFDYFFEYIKSQDFEKAADLRDKIKKYLEKL